MVRVGLGRIDRRKGENDDCMLYMQGIRVRGLGSGGCGMARHNGTARLYFRLSYRSTSDESQSVWNTYRTDFRLVLAPGAGEEFQARHWQGAVQ